MAKKNNNNGVENNDPSTSKIVKWVKSFQGTELVKSEGQGNKLRVVGKVDPTKLRDELATKTKNKVDLVSPQPKKDNKVNQDDANDTKKKQPEKTDNVENPKKAPLTTVVFKFDFRCHKCEEKARKVAACTRGCKSIDADSRRDLMTVMGSMDVQKLADRLREKLKKPVEIVPPKKKNGGNKGNDSNDGNDGNDSNGGGRGDEKKKKEDEGNGGGKMKYPAGQSGFGQVSSVKVHRHGYGYQNGALETGEKMLLLCCEVFGLLVMYNHLAKDIYPNVTNVTLHTHHLLYI